MLRSILDSHPKFIALPEVFNDHTNNLTEEINLPSFNRFLIEKTKQTPETVLLNYRQSMVESYFDQICAYTEERQAGALIDVKYNSLHQAEGHWKDVDEAPHMLKIFKDRKMPVIHMMRRNKVAVAISTIRAQKTKQYRAVESAAVEVSQTTLQIDPDILLWSLQALDRREQLVDQWLRSFKIPHITISYEELFVGKPGSAISSLSFETISNFLGISHSELSLQPKTLKLSMRPYCEEIENYSEVEELLRETQYHGQLTGEDTSV